MNLICLKCGTNWPAESSHGYMHYHHILPRGYRKEEGDTILLCTKCHNIIHLKISCGVGYHLMKYPEIWKDIQLDIKKRTQRWLDED